MPSQVFSQQNAALKKGFESFLSDPALKNASIGFCILNPEKGNTVFSFHDSTPMVPASCLKIVTTGAALALLGPQYHFKTKIGYNGRIDSKGILHGDIFISGGGDPTLGSERWGKEKSMSAFAELISQEIKSSGIKHVEGKLVIDVNHFDNQYCCKSWACDDTGNYFGAGASAFNFNENKYDIKLQPGMKKGDSVKILSYSPELLHLNFDNRLLTGDPHSGDLSNIFPGPNDSSVLLDGSIQPSKTPLTIKGAMPDPPEFAAKYLAEKLYYAGLLDHKNGWQVNDASAEIVNPSLKIIDSIESPELVDIVHFTNLNSINLYAECILKETGSIVNGSGTRQSGILAVKKFWSNEGVDTSGLYMEDGCGLSVNDEISALQLCQMLSAMEKQRFFMKFLESLPVAGQSGAMKSMGKGTPIEGRLFCKTGHINGIRAYSGYFKNKSGKWICIALIVNNYTSSSKEIHDAIERLLIALPAAN